MSERMRLAMEQAKYCWDKAWEVSPTFVEKYLLLCEQLLMARPRVKGDYFRKHCKDNGLSLPWQLHHNTWVSGPKALEKLGWIRPIGKAEPSQKHNHMDSVTLWESLLFEETKEAA